MEGNKFKISEFSLITGIPVRTLRYYDDIDVLKPGYVDSFTNYRYYTKDNLKDAKNILEMKSLNFTLDEIRDHKDDLDMDTIENKINETKTEINRLEKCLTQLNEMYNNRRKSVKVRTIINDKAA